MKTVPIDTPDVSHADIVDGAFRHVCMDFACKLETLLAETRRRGLTDAEVKAVLQESESDICGERYSAWRTGAGELFLQHDNGVNHIVASVNELFMELEGCSRHGLPSDRTSDAGYDAPANSAVRSTVLLLNSLHDVRDLPEAG